VCRKEHRTYRTNLQLLVLAATEDCSQLAGLQTGMRGRGEVRLTLNFWNCTGNPCFLRFQERARHKNLAGKCGLQTVEGEGAGMRGGGGPSNTEFL
jgi:hypothetical protein